MRGQCYGLKFNCNLAQYEKLPKDQVKGLVDGLEFDFYHGWGVIRDVSGRFVGGERVVQYTEVGGILEHIIKFGLSDNAI